MKGSTKRKRLKKELWKDYLKRKWDEVNKIPKRNPSTQSKTIA
ncbi:hypothetical protein [Evansella cellulosilytica]|uniref:Uncharacterized protein n=1 Tax=Evansella cellulosilytica (strain ATCC 21833 / DSM 2522 / FERM P-1141 / JCM 9156 / N-4) TaxID=649639 RepID=E6TX68_EVAC2|nr:hypothetical protein [Evansella cellulosilytica]ADU31157.1 hypothetical protein Bcell_2906 [Evansella cellulosilytica DSM 2522]